MPTKIELEDRIAVLEKRIDELEQELAEKNALLGANPGNTGYLVRTPNPTFSGSTAGVMFRHGKAFLRDDEPGSEQKALILANDFGYEVEKVS